MNKNAGFTLIELIVTVVLAAIILTIGVPSFRDTLQNNRRTAQINEIITAFNTTRSEAIKRGTQVTMCKSTNGTSCDTTTCNAGTGSNCWESGWVIFADANGDGTIDTTDTIINVHGALNPGLSFRSGSTFINWIGYRSNGTSRGNGAAATDTDSNRTFRICDVRGVDQARFAVVNATGRLSIREKQSGDSCP